MKQYTHLNTCCSDRRTPNECQRNGWIDRSIDRAHTSNDAHQKVQADESGLKIHIYEIKTKPAKSRPTETATK